jgi:hypothetical protein
MDDFWQVAEQRMCPGPIQQVRAAEHDRRSSRTVPVLVGWYPVIVFAGWNLGH